MTKKKFAQGLIVVVALCLNATAGRAQNSRFFLTVGGSSISDTRSFSEASFPFSSTFATGGRGSVGFEHPLRKSKIFGIEGSVGFGQNNLKLSNLNTSPATIKSYGLRDYRFSGDFVAHMPGGYRGIRPYVLVGAEYDDFSPTSAASALAAKQGFAYAAVAKLASQGAGGVNFGGGLDWRGASRLGLRLDVRYHSTSAPTFGLPTSQPATAGLPWFPNTGSARNMEYSVGIVYHFGREKAAPAPTESSQRPSPRRESSRRPSSKPLPSSPPSPF